MAKKISGKIRALIIFAISVIVLAFVDQITKIWAVDVLKKNDPIVIIDGVFEFHYLENTGTAWGLFGGAVNFFIITTVIILVGIIYVEYKMPFTKKYMPMHITAILIGAGGIGNFIDRAVLGYVRDFIYFKLIDFPVFNVADMYVTVSQILFVILILFVYHEGDFKFLKPGKSKRI